MQKMPSWLEDFLEPFSGDPNPGSYLGFTTIPATMSDVLTQDELSVFLCHNVRQHVMYYEEGPDGKKNYECLECPSGNA